MANRILLTIEEMTGGVGIFEIDLSVPGKPVHERTIRIEGNHKTKENEILPLDSSKHYFEYSGKKYTLEVCKNRNEEKEHQLRFLESAVNSFSEAVYIVYHDQEKMGRIAYVNDAASRMLQYTRKEFLEMTIFDLDTSLPTKDIQEKMAMLIDTKQEINFETQHRTKYGNIVDIEVTASFFEYEGNMAGLSIAKDITENKLTRQKIEFLASYDSLTGLPNLEMLKDETELMVNHAKRNNVRSALLLVDIDGFKVINNSIGFDAGDLLLKIIAIRLRQYSENTDTLGRHGSDKFLWLASNIAEDKDVINTAEKIIKLFNEPFDVNGELIYITVSIGISVFPINGEKFDVLLQNAEIAMKKAKTYGGNTYFIGKDEMEYNLKDRFQIQNQIMSGIKNDEFTLHYQPQIDTKSKKVIGAEALVRWNHPELGMLSPAKFIPIAESSGLIVPLGEWIINEACKQTAKWSREEIDIIVAMNISALQFKRSNFEEIVKDAIASSGVDPERLELELTESILINDMEDVLTTVRNLKDIGMQVSIDDFGTGYSSLSYLKRFAVDKLKIDKSFIDDMHKDEESEAIVRTIIQMAKSFRLKTIAEGVEIEETVAMLDDYGCDEIQGYYYAKPMNPSDFEKYYKKLV